MEVLVLDGKEYVKASTAAERAGYTADYVGQLCRAGKVDAHLVGRSWYVNVDELGSHKTESKRNARVKAREQVHKAIEERKQEQQIPKVEKNFERHINYEEDDTELIPEVRKISIESLTPVAAKATKVKHSPKNKDTKYVLENEGDKIVMSGDLEVIDVTDEDYEGSDTVFLESKINKTPSKKGKKHEKPIQQNHPSELHLVVKNEDTDIPEKTSKNKAIPEEQKPVEIAKHDVKKAFMERLAEKDDSTDTLVETNVKTQSDNGKFNTNGLQEVTVTPSHATNKAKKGHLFIFTSIVCLFSIFLVLFTATIEQDWRYQNNSENGVTLDTSYHINIEDFLNRVKQEILPVLQLNILPLNSHKLKLGEQHYHENIL